MSLNLVKSSRAVTVSNAVIGVNQAKATLAFKFRLNGPISQAAYNGLYFLSRTATNGLIVSSQSVNDAAQSMVLNCAWRASNGTGLAFRPTIYPDIVYSIVMTYDKDVAADQAVWCNVVKGQMAPTQSVPLHASSTALEIGLQGATGNGRDFSIEDLMWWNGWVAGMADVSAIAAGTATPLNTGLSATWRGYWTLAGPIGNTAAPGDSAMANQVDGSWPFTPSSNAGVAGSAAVYGAPMVYTPQATLAPPIVTTGGKSIIVQVKTPGGNALSINSFGPDVSVKINGGSSFAPSYRYTPTNNDAVFLNFPSGKVAAEGDVVTLTAVEGAFATSLGASQAATDIACVNRAGKAIFGDEPRTIPAGLNYDYPAEAYYGFSQGRVNWWGRIQLDKFTNPTWFRDDGTLKVNRTKVYLAFTDNPTWVDLLNHPMPTGKWAVKYKPLDVGGLTDISLTTNTPGACSELTDYRYTGPDGYVTKVYNTVPSVEYANTLASAITTTSQTTFTLANTTNLAPQAASGLPVLWIRVESEYMRLIAVNTTTKEVTVVRGEFGSTPATHANGTACVSCYYTQSPILQVNVTGPGGVPNYAPDVMVCWEQDFTLPATPGPFTDLDNSEENRNRPTKFYRDSLPNAGICRYMASTGAFTMVAEPEHMRRSSDVLWGLDSKFYNNFRFKDVKAFDPLDTPYGYVHLNDFPDAETYTATLSSAIVTAPAGETPDSKTVETIQISDAATAIIVPGTRLWIGSEQMRVVAVSGTNVDVVRGTMGTTPTTHATGTITCGWRVSLADPAKYESVGRVALDVTTDIPHGLRSFMWGEAAADLDMNPEARSTITLASTILPGPTQKTFSVSLADPDFWPYMQPGIYVKFGSDVMRVLSANQATNEVTVEAGPPATSPTHLAGEIGTTLCTGFFCRAKDGSGTYAWSPKQAVAIYPIVLGLDRLLVSCHINTTKVMVVDHPQSWDQTPKIVGSVDQSQAHFRFPVSLWPYEWTAKMTALAPGAIHWVVVPVLSSDDVIRDIALQTYDNLPIGAGHQVVVEYGNELWNPIFPFQTFMPKIGALAGLSSETDVASWYDYPVIRARQAADIFEEVRVALGHDAPALLSLPSQTNAIDRQILRGEIHGVYADVAATAPYYQPPYTAACAAAFNASDDEQAIDLWGYEMRHNLTSGTMAIARTDAAALDRYRDRTGRDIKWWTYEGGTATYLPTPTNGIFDTAVYPQGPARTMDLNYHPNMRFAIEDMLSTAQARGIHAFCFFDHCHWPHNQSKGSGSYLEMWGFHGWHGQPYGKGDGSDGKADNRLNLAQAGKPNTKGPLVNFPLNKVSTKMQGLLDWNAARVGDEEPEPEPEATPPPGTFAHWHRGSLYLAAAATTSPTGHFNHAFRNSLETPVIFLASAFPETMTGGGTAGGTATPAWSYLKTPSGGGTAGGTTPVSLAVNPLALGSFGYWYRNELYLAAARTSTGHFEHSFRNSVETPVVIAGADVAEHMTGGGTAGGVTTRTYVARPAPVGGGTAGGLTRVAMAYLKRPIGGGVGGGVTTASLATTRRMTGGGRGGGRTAVGVETARAMIGGGRGGGLTPVVGSAAYTAQMTGGGTAGGAAGLTSAYIKRPVGGGRGGGRTPTNILVKPAGGGRGGGTATVDSPTNQEMTGGGRGGGTARVISRTIYIRPDAARRTPGRDSIDPYSSVVIEQST